MEETASLGMIKQTEQGRGGGEGSGDAGRQGRERKARRTRGQSVTHTGAGTPGVTHT